MSYTPDSPAASASQTTAETSSATQRTQTDAPTDTATPSLTDDAVNPYRTVAGSLPNPTTPVPESVAAHDPEAASEFTIPCDTVPASTIPFNTDSLQWRSWRSKFSTIAALYVLAARHYADTLASRRTVHAMFSPPQADIRTADDITRWRQRVTDIAQEHGIRGGVAVFHGYRVYQETADEFLSHIQGTEYDDTASDVLLWEWIRQNDWRNHVQWGPHFHIIGLAHPDEDQIDDYTGNAVFQRLRTFPEYTRDMPMDTVIEHRSVAKDAIDHVTFNPNDPSPPLSWFGDLHGDAWWSAKQYATDTTINNIRSKLIDGPPAPTTDL